MKIHKGQGKVDLERAEFDRRARLLFKGTPLNENPQAVKQVIDGLWQEYDDSDKSPQTRKAGAQFAKPNFELDVEWLAARQAIHQAKKAHDSKKTPLRILLINGSPRSDNTCPGEMSKSHRLCESAKKIFQKSKIEFEYLDLSRLTSEYGRNIHPCKACVSTAMPMCHFPCSCYPNQALGQTQDWMNEIYPMWMRAHGVMIVTPVHWYSPPGCFEITDGSHGLCRWRQSRSHHHRRQGPKARKKIRIEGMGLSPSHRRPIFFGFRAWRYRRQFRGEARFSHLVE